MEIVYDIKDIDNAAKEFISFIKDHKIIVLSGELGAGKTTFINALCKQYEIAESVTSPTYSLIHEYHFNKNKIIYHMDLYRIRSAREAIDAGVEDCITSGEICLIEWPEVAATLLPDRYIKIIIQSLPLNKRKLIAQLH